MQGSDGQSEVPRYLGLLEAPLVGPSRMPHKVPTLAGESPTDPVSIQVEFRRPRPHLPARLAWREPTAAKVGWEPSP